MNGTIFAMLIILQSGVGGIVSTSIGGPATLPIFKTKNACEEAIPVVIEGYKKIKTSFLGNDVTASCVEVKTE